MKVLIWVNQFPTFSETFIRDQIIHLKKEGIDTSIFCNYRNDNELLALKDYSEYNLMGDRVCLEELIPKNKIIRFVKAIQIIFSALFSKHLAVYLKSLNYKKYGKESLNLTWFFVIYYLLKQKIEIIHAHFGPNGNKAAMLKEMGVPVKVYTTFHGYDVRLGIKEGGGIYNKVFNQADGIIAIADYNKNKLLEFGANKSTIINLPNGVDVDYFKPLENKEAKKVIKLLSVARLAPEKGILLFLEALNNFLKKNSNLQIEYVIIGEGALRSQIEGFINDNDLKDRVHLLGSKNTEEVKNEMILADAFVLSSLAEVLPTVLLEAQACALPILATDVGAVKEMLPNSSVIVKSNSVEALENGLEELIGNKEKWNIIGEEHRYNVSQHFNIHKVVQQLINEYKNNN